MSFFNLNRSKKSVFTVVQQESSTTTSTSSGITKTSYQIKSSISTGNPVDGVSYNRSKSSPVLSSSYIPSSIKEIEPEEEESCHKSLEVDEGFINSCLQKHNFYREKHAASPLKINTKLCKYSQEWAKKLAKKGQMEHRKDSEYGENLYFKWSSNSKMVIGGDEAVASWYSEIKDYEYGTDRSVSKTGHFTQVVWKESTELGVGMARNSKGEIYVVCNYNPPGNFIGRFKENVLPPRFETNLIE